MVGWARPSGKGKIRAMCSLRSVYVTFSLRSVGVSLTLEEWSSCGGEIGMPRGRAGFKKAYGIDVRGGPVDGDGGEDNTHTV